MHVRMIGASITLTVLLAMTGCAFGTTDAATTSPGTTAAVPPQPTSTQAPESSSTDAPGAEDTCDVLARVDWQEQSAGWKQVAGGVPFDNGERSGAAGTAHLNANGRVIGYTVAAGDAPSVIEDRFCIDHVSVLRFNGYWVGGDGKDIAPGDYLYLAPNPDVPNPNA